MTHEFKRQETPQGKLAIDYPHWEEVGDVLTRHVYNGYDQSYVREEKAVPLFQELRYMLRYQAFSHIDQRPGGPKPDNVKIVDQFEADIAHELKQRLSEADEAVLSEIRANGVGKLPSIIFPDLVDEDGFKQMMDGYITKSPASTSNQGRNILHGRAAKLGLLGLGAGGLGFTLWKAGVFENISNSQETSPNPTPTPTVPAQLSEEQTERRYGTRHIEPTFTPSPAATVTSTVVPPTPIPTETATPAVVFNGFRFGNIQLGGITTLQSGEDLATKVGRFSFKVNFLPQNGESTNQEDWQNVNAGWKEHPDDMIAYTTAQNSTVVLGHSLRGTTLRSPYGDPPDTTNVYRQLPLEWERVCAVDQSCIGKSISLVSGTQVQEGVIIDTTVIPTADVFVDGLVLNNTKDNKPVYVDLDVLHLPQTFRKPGLIIFVSCTGEPLGNNQWSHRALMAVQPK